MHINYLDVFLLYLELMEDSSTLHIFFKRDNAAPMSPVPALISTWTMSEIDCARNTLHSGGKSFSFDKHECYIYLEFDGSHDALLTY